LISESQKQETHLKNWQISCCKNAPAEYLEDYVFDIVNQLNAAREIIDSASEKFN
ncbi:MAG: hypothetical protein HC894_26400, partial [Microcoleus sp. SM1_3_4]|nr:hypothetical protein [Microcoleus sp. SM1_3_4]